MSMDRVPYPDIQTGDAAYAARVIEYVQNKGEQERSTDTNTVLTDTSQHKFEQMLYAESGCLGRDLRRMTRDALPTAEQLDTVHSVADLVALAETTVEEAWDSSRSQEVHDLCARVLETAGDRLAEYPDLQALLSDPARLDRLIGMRFFGIACDLATVDPQAWNTLLAFSSERQVAKISLLKRWIRGRRANDATDGAPEVTYTYNRIQQDVFDRIGTSRTEVNLYLTLASAINIMVDRAYIKQVHMASKLEFADDNKRRIYTELDPADPVPVADLMQFEVGAIAWGLGKVASRTEDLLSEEPPRLAETYRTLPNFLRALADAYLSAEKDPEELEKIWLRAGSLFNQLVDDECPISILFQDEPDSLIGGQVGFEAQVGFRTKRTISIEKQLGALTRLANSIQSEIADAALQSTLTKQEESKNIVSEVDISAGTDLYWRTRGQSFDAALGTSALHAKAMSDLGMGTELEPTRGLIANLELDDAAYAAYSVQDTNLHEQAHGITRRDNQLILDRLGDTHASTVLEEIKAEAGSMLLYTAPQAGALFEGQNARYVFEAKLCAVNGYLASKGSTEGSNDERYFLTGVAIVNELLAEGILVPSDSAQYEIKEPERGVRLIAELGQHVLRDFYTNPDCQPAQVESYIDHLRRLRSTPVVAAYIRALKA